MAIGDLIVTDDRLGVGTTEGLSTLTVRARAPFTLTGTLSAVAASTTVTGISTLFLSELSVGDRITLGSYWNSTKAVVAIASDTSLTVDTPFIDSETGQDIQANPSTARFDDNTGVAVTVVNDQGNVGIGTAGPNGMLDVSGPGAGDFFGCPVGIRVHSGQSSDAWQLVLTTEADDKKPGAAIWVTQFQDDGGATMTFSVYDGDTSIVDAARIDGHGFHLQTAFTSGPIGIQSNYSIQPTDHQVLADAGAGGITVTLPAVADSVGRLLAVIKSGGAGAVTVAPAASETINGGATGKTISTLYDGLQLISTGSTWIATVMTAA